MGRSAVDPKPDLERDLDADLDADLETYPEAYSETSQEMTVPGWVVLTLLPAVLMPVNAELAKEQWPVLRDGVLMLVGLTTVVAVVACLGSAWTAIRLARSGKLGWPVVIVAVPAALVGGYFGVLAALRGAMLPPGSGC